MPLTLPDVTLICLDHLMPRGVAAFESCLEACDFGDAKILSHAGSHRFLQPIPQVKSVKEYSEFCLRSLKDWFTTSHCLVVQHDGYILNPAAWRDEFLDYDYVGAPWLWHGGVVGNGGFSLRSLKLARETASPDFEPNFIPEFPNEDWSICVTNRALMESRGIKFAPLDLASKFSVEDSPWTGQFGFHGKKTGIIP